MLNYQRVWNRTIGGKKKRGKGEKGKRGSLRKSQFFADTLQRSLYGSGHAVETFTEEGHGLFFVDPVVYESNLGMVKHHLANLEFTY